MIAQAPPRILWRQVWGLSAVLVAVSFSWMAYSLYQPKILQDLGFVSLASWLGILQGLFGAVLEPLVGGVSDRVQTRFGSRIPMIMLGTTLAGLLFVGLALLLHWQIPLALRWIVPVLMCLWVGAMIIFRGPVIALLRQAAPLAALPQANALLTVAFGVMGALTPVLNLGLKIWGASVAFLLGAILLTLAAGICYAGVPHRRLFPNIAMAPLPVSWQRMGLIFGAGFGSGLEANLLLRAFPQTLQTHLFGWVLGWGADWIAAAILLVSALVALPMGALTTRIGVKRSMLLGLTAIALGQGLFLWQPNQGLAIALLLLVGAAFGLVFESQIPFALSMVPASRAGLGTGLYFGGIGAATALLSAVFVRSGNLALMTEFLLAIGALCLAGVSIGILPGPKSPVASE